MSLSILLSKYITQMVDGDSFDMTRTTTTRWLSAGVDGNWLSYHRWL